MPAEAKHIYALGMVIREISRRIAILTFVRNSRSIKSMLPQYSAPYAICIRHVAHVISSTGKKRKSVLPANAKGDRHSAYSAITYPPTARIVVEFSPYTHAAYPLFNVFMPIVQNRPHVKHVHSKAVEIVTVLFS